MRVVIQRVSKASVHVEEKVVGEIHRGLVVLLGIHRDDTENLLSSFVKKIVHLRIFSDDEQKMHYSLLEVEGELLVVSQFTLYADYKSGRRPSFIENASQEKAKKFYEKFLIEAKKYVKCVQTGIFGAYMQVALINDGPVTCIMDTLG